MLTSSELPTLSVCTPGFVQAPDAGGSLALEDSRQWTTRMNNERQVYAALDCHFDWAKSVLRDWEVSLAFTSRVGVGSGAELIGLAAEERRLKESSPGRGNRVFVMPPPFSGGREQRPTAL